jgi:hypothetical protein
VDRPEQDAKRKHGQQRRRSAVGRSGNLASNNLNVIAAEGGRVFSSISKKNEKDALFCWQFHKSLHCLLERHLGAAGTPRYNFVSQPLEPSPVPVQPIGSRAHVMRPHRRLVGGFLRRAALDVHVPP